MLYAPFEKVVCLNDLNDPNDLNDLNGSRLFFFLLGSRRSHRHFGWDGWILHVDVLSSSVDCVQPFPQWICRWSNCQQRISWIQHWATLEGAKQTCYREERSWEKQVEKEIPETLDLKEPERRPCKLPYWCSRTHCRCFLVFCNAVQRLKQSKMVIVLQTLSGRSAYQLPVVTIQGIAPSTDVVLHRGHRGKVKELFAGDNALWNSLFWFRAYRININSAEHYIDRFVAFTSTTCFANRHIRLFVARSMTYANQQPWEATRHSARPPWRCSTAPWALQPKMWSYLGFFQLPPCRTPYNLPNWCHVALFLTKSLDHARIRSN